MRATCAVFICLTLFVLANSSFAAMSSTNYEIRWDSVGLGGSDTSSSASYQLRDTLGDNGSGRSTSDSYLIDAGYRGGIFDKIIAFELFAQSSTTTNATALSGTTITVSDSSSFSSGQKVALIQDFGASQVAGVGEITGISGNDITLDTLDTGGAVISIDGSGDYLYLMNATSINFGSVNENSLAQSVIGWEVNVDVDGGYTVSVIEDANLSSGVNDIDDVSDGSVTAGSEEYGARSSDQSLSNSTFDTQDTAITSSFQEVGSRSSAAFSSRDLLTIKAATASTSINGTYSHNLTIIVSGNY
ncbi:MAG: hypothetical protein ABIH67_03715 [Candidatus Uhrbacteria bacterium]